MKNLKNLQISTISTIEMNEIKGGGQFWNYLRNQWNQDSPPPWENDDDD